MTSTVNESIWFSLKVFQLKRSGRSEFDIQTGDFRRAINEMSFFSFKVATSSVNSSSLVGYVCNKYASFCSHQGPPTEKMYEYRDNTLSYLGDHLNVKKE